MRKIRERKYWEGLGLEKETGFHKKKAAARAQKIRVHSRTSPVIKFARKICACEEGAQRA